MLNVREAEAAIASFISSARSEETALSAAVGRWLAEDIVAERDHPPFDRMTHDGIAVASANVAAGQRAYRIEGYAAAGAVRRVLADPSACVEVATGAPLPEGCDAVVPYEALRLESGIASLREGLAVQPGQMIHRQGSDAGRGARLLLKGRRIGAPEIAILATNGVARVPVMRLPSIGILSTGDELVAPDAVPADHQIRRSNDAMLRAALASAGFPGAAIAHAADDAARLREAIEMQLEACDCLIIVGGVSRGQFDLVPDILSALGAQLHFHRVAQRPGKPMLFATLGETPVFGLPGNPVSCLVCLTRYVIPALRRQQGDDPTPRAMRLAAAMRPHDELTLFIPVTRGAQPGDVVPRPTQGSGDFIGLVGSEGFIELPPNASGAVGEMVDFFPWVAT